MRSGKDLLQIAQIQAEINADFLLTTNSDEFTRKGELIADYGDFGDYLISTKGKLRHGLTQDWHGLFNRAEEEVRIALTTKFAKLLGAA